MGCLHAMRGAWSRLPRYLVNPVALPARPQLTVSWVALATVSRSEASQPQAQCDLQLLPTDYNQLSNTNY